jgi:hypothetical protein
VSASLYGRAFGGWPLKGDKLSRTIYLDESGIGNLENDPVTVVAGIILNSDKQWLALENYLREMVEEYAPVAERPGLVWHAKDLFWGTKAFHKDRWSEALRYKVLDELASIPSRFEFPIVWGAIERQKVALRHPELNAVRQKTHCYMLGTSICLMQAEMYMRTCASGEVASVVLENTSDVRRQVKGLHQFLRGSDAIAVGESSKYLPLSKIIDTPHFAEKDEASQIFRG